MRILVLGFGNPGRFDDGLGPAFAQEIDRAGIAGLTVDADYQLAVEDAATVAEHDLALFVDAAVEGPEPFAVGRLRPTTERSFSSHSVAPAGVLGLARELFGACTPALLLAIRGYRFEGFGEGLSDGARANLEAALRFAMPLLAGGGLRELWERLEEGAAPASV